MSNLEYYRVGLETTAFRFWLRVMRSSILNANLGVWSLTICRMPGSNSWKRLSPASLPIVEPKSLNGAEAERDQEGRRALWAATKLSTPKKYDAFSLFFPESSRVTKICEAA